VIIRGLRRRTGILVAGSLLTGCLTGTGGGAGTSALTAGMVKAEIVTGETTQADILQIFGAPNLVTVSSEDDEVWNYSRMAFESASSSGGMLALVWPASALIGGGASGSASRATTRSFDLILIFDDRDRVKKYTVIQAAYE
jgi:hypothetical protein